MNRADAPAARGDKRSAMRKALFAAFRLETLLMGLTFAASLLLNRTLGAEERGHLAIIMLLPMTVTAIGCCQWDRLVKGMITSGRLTPAEAWNRTWKYAAMLTVPVVSVSVCGCLLWGEIPDAYKWLAILYGLNFPSHFIGGCLAALVLAAGRMKDSYRIKLAFQTAYLLVIGLLWLMGRLDVGGVIFGYFFVHGAAMVAGWFVRPRPCADESLSKGWPSMQPLMKGFGPYAMESAGAQAHAWALTLFTTAATLGAYVAISAMLVPLNLVSNSILNVATTHLDWKNPRVVVGFLCKGTFAVLGLAAVASVCGWYLGKPVLAWLLGGEYPEYTWMFPWIAWIVAAQSLGSQWHLSLQMSGMDEWYLRIQTWEPFVRLGFALAGGGLGGTLGILIGLSVGVSFRALAAGWVLHRKVSGEVGA